MKKWEDIRVDVDAVAEEVRKKSQEGKLLSQSEAALVRESELYARMDKKREEEKKQEKILKEIEQKERENRERQQKIEDVKEVLKNDGEDLKDGENIENEKKDTKLKVDVIEVEQEEKEVEETAYQMNRRREFEKKYGVEVIYVKYDNGLPAEDFTLKKYISAEYPEDDYILIKEDEKEKQITKYEFENFYIGLGFEKEREINVIAKEVINNLQDENDDVEEEQKEKKNTDDENETQKIKQDVQELDDAEADIEQHKNDYESYRVEMTGVLNSYLQEAVKSDKELDVAIEDAYHIMRGCRFDYIIAGSKLFGSIDVTMPQIDDVKFDLSDAQYKNLFDQWVIESGSNDYIAKIYLTYNDVQNKDLDKINVNGKSIKKYTISFKKMSQEEKFFDVARDIKKKFEDIMQLVGLESSIWGKSDTWVYWDMAKQQYFFDHQDEADEKYDIGDPIADNNLQQQIIDRHIGWELYSGNRNNKEMKTYLYEKFNTNSEIMSFLNKKPKKNNDLSSIDLASLGKLVREAI